MVNQNASQTVFEIHLTANNSLSGCLARARAKAARGSQKPGDWRRRCRNLRPHKHKAERFFGQCRGPASTRPQVAACSPALNASQCPT